MNSFQKVNINRMIAEMIISTLVNLICNLIKVNNNIAIVTASTVFTTDYYSIFYR